MSALDHTKSFALTPFNRRGGDLLLLTVHEPRGETTRGVAAPGEALEALETLLERARLGNRARGLQRARHGVGVFPPRPRAVARVPVERGRHRWHLRSTPAHLLRARAPQRGRPDLEGA